MEKTGLISVFFLTMGFMGTTNAEEDKSWSDEAELSYISTGGNTEVETFSLKNKYKYKFTEASRMVWKLGALKSKTDGVLSSERYMTDLRGEQYFTPRTYLYENIGWLNDDFSGIHKRVYVGFGPGHHFLNGPIHTLTAELGVSYVEETYVVGSKQDFVEGRLFAEYMFAFTKKNRFTQSVEYLYDFDVTDNERINSETAVIAALNSNLSLKASYTVMYDNLPVPATLEKRDDIVSIAIVANY